MERTNGSDVVINGIVLPNHVVLELQRLGRALEWYNSGELHSAVLACAVDRKLIDDPNGVNFMDQLELTDEEKRKADLHARGITEHPEQEHIYKNRYANNNEPDEHRHEKEEDCENEKPASKILSFCKRLKEAKQKVFGQDNKIAYYSLIFMVLIQKYHNFILTSNA